MSEVPMVFNHLSGVREGNFDWGHPNDTQVCYDFWLRPEAPVGCCKSFSLKPEQCPSINYWRGDSCGDLLDLLDHLIAEAEKYIFCSSLEGLRKTRAYVESCSDQDDADFTLHAVAQAKADIAELQQKLAEKRKTLEFWQGILRKLQAPEEVA